MTYHQEHRAPPGCREPRCGHLVESVVTLGGKSQAADRCAARHPMHPQCPWNTNKMERKNRD